MSLYQSIALKALEVGRTPDFVLVVCVWLTLILGGLLFSGVRAIVRWFTKRKL